MRLKVELPDVKPSSQTRPRRPPTPSAPPLTSTQVDDDDYNDDDNPPESVWQHNSISRVLQIVTSSRHTMKMDRRSSDLLAGCLLPEDIPSVRSRVVRLFLCSAGTDSGTERTVFMERVYPRLREYCRQRYALEFQVVDLHWGVTEDPQSGQSLADFRKEQIRKCQEMSAGPSFLAFIGQKYGPSPLPTSIQADHYKVIRAALHAHRGRDTRNAPLLDHCYLIDNNSVPPVYVLRPATLIMQDLPQLQDKWCSGDRGGERQWGEVQGTLVSLLQRGAELAYLDGALDSDLRSSFLMSDLEKEVQLGIESCDNPHKRCVLMLRDIVDLKNYCQHPQAAAYTQLTTLPPAASAASAASAAAPARSGGGVAAGATCPSAAAAGPVPVPDPEADNRLQVLRNRARGLISESNTLQHEVLWRFDHVIHPTLHRDYLETLSCQLHDAVQRLVDECAQSMAGEDGESVPPLVTESLQHWAHCKDRVQRFVPCLPQLQQLRDYVTGHSDRPLVLHGPSGSGKTMLLSKLALELRELAPGHLLSLVRYVGLTASASDTRQLLLGMCRQLSTALGYLPQHVPVDYKDLQRFFPRLLQSVPAHLTLVIILDGLDQLLPEDGAHSLVWFPSLLPPHVKVVVSTDPEGQGVLQRLQGEVLKDSPSSFLQLQPLDMDQCQTLLRHCLASHDRQITEEQMEKFSERFQNCCAVPLYVTLLAREARNLTSFSPAHSLTLPTDCPQAIQSFFLRLEEHHGRPVVGRCMAYLVASGTGLSDMEMEDLLSLDDTVLNHLFPPLQHPPLRRVPSAVWLKIRRDVESFLVTREADGVTVTTWEHDSFAQAARDRYLQDPEEVKKVHSLMADYFLGTWSGIAKPVQLAEGDSQFPPCGAQADRLVPTQPLTFCAQGDSSTPQRFNKRMYDQVPRHLVLSGRQAELNTRVLFNYEWLFNKTRALSLQQCLADFALNPGPQASLVLAALRAAAPTIERDMNNMPAEITGRLLPYYATHASIRALIRSCDLDGMKHCALLPNFPYQEVPGSSLQFNLECPVAPDYMGLVHGDRYLLCKRTDHSHVYVFDMVSGELKDTIFTSKGELYVTPNGHYFVIVDHVTEKSFKIHDSGSGEFLGQIILLNHMRLRTDKYHAGPLSLTDDRLCAVVETSDTSVLFICEVPSGDMLQIIGLDGKATVCQITPDGQHVLCNSNDFVLVYQLYGLQHVCTESVAHKPQALTFTRDGLRAFLATPPDPQLVVMHLQGGQVEMVYKVSLAEHLQGDVIRTLRVSPSDQLLLVHSDNQLLVHERAREQVVAQLTRPEQVPKEFRLPKSHYKEMVFTNADFTRDSQCVIATIFRNIYIWQISDSQLLTTIQAPMGVISSLLVVGGRQGAAAAGGGGQLVLTRSQDSREVQVWALDPASTSTSTTTSTTSTISSSNNTANDNSSSSRSGGVGGSQRVDSLDKLTGAVQRVLVTQDNAMAFVQCHQSDEVGVFDMRTGAMLDLLTHDCKVQDLAITPSGHMALVSTSPRLSGTAAKLWDLTERRIIKEWGDHAGHCLSLHATNSIIYVSQQQPLLHAPYDISIIHFIGDTHTVHDNPASVKYLRSKPVVTHDDRFIVFSSALHCEERSGRFQSPCLVVFDMTSGLKRTCYDAKSVGLEDLMEDMVSVQACPRDESCVAVVVSCRQSSGEEADILLNKEEENGDIHQEHHDNVQEALLSSPRTQLSTITNTNTPRAAAEEEDEVKPKLTAGFFILDLRQGCITTMNFLQPAPDTPFPPRLVFSTDFNLCMDEASSLYDLGENTALSGHLPYPAGTLPPSCMALHGEAVIYCQGSVLHVLRVRDGSVLARCEVHAPVCEVTVCWDQRTLLVGCQDGTLASYVLVDPAKDRHPVHLVGTIKSRQVGGEGGLPDLKDTDGRLSRSWDKVEVSSAPPYSRPPSAVSPGCKDKLILRQIEPLPRFRPKSDTFLYLNTKKSQACSVM